MSTRTAGFFAFLILLALAAYQIWHVYPLLPEKLASHFDFSGRPDGWTNKTTFVGIYIAVIAFSAVTFWGAAFLITKLPNSMLNLPNKEYWMSPGRKQETLDFIAGWLVWFGAATLVFLVAVFHEVFQFNLTHATKLSNVWFYLVVFLIFTGFWCFRLVLRFRTVRAGV